MANPLTHAKLVYVAGHGSPAGGRREQSLSRQLLRSISRAWRATREPRRAEPRAIWRPGEACRTDLAQPSPAMAPIPFSLSSTSEISDLCLILVFCSVKLEKRNEERIPG
jgi:hypothetical protein